MLNVTNINLNAEAVVRSLRDALLITRDYSDSITRLKKTIANLPSGTLQISHGHNGVYFYCGGRYLGKKSNKLYSLARKRYCAALLEVLTLHSNSPGAGAKNYHSHMEKCRLSFDKLASLIFDYSKGNLELPRIILTPKQYRWFTGRYVKKNVSEKQKKLNLMSPQGDYMRSKSEQNIAFSFWDYAIPSHFEEQYQMNVHEIELALEEMLRQRGENINRLFYYDGSTCHWNLPSDLSWMDTTGSAWRTYDPRTGCLTIYPDFTIMLADGSLVFWEHEGLWLQPAYRSNANERISLIHHAGHIPFERIIQSGEAEANDRQVLTQIIKSRILPAVWF